jgi:hypothetical protein
MGQTGADVQLSADAKRAFPFAVECKSLAKQAVQTHYEQAEAHAAESKVPLHPLVVLKENGKQPLVVLDAALFFLIWRQYETSTRD